MQIVWNLILVDQFIYSYIIQSLVSSCALWLSAFLDHSVRFAGDHLFERTMIDQTCQLSNQHH